MVKSSVPSRPVPDAAPFKSPSSLKPSRELILIVPASPCKVSRTNPVSVCVSFTIDVPDTSNTLPSLRMTAPFCAVISILPALNTAAFIKLACELGSNWLLPNALKLAFSPIKIACVAS